MTQTIQNIMNINNGHNLVDISSNLRKNTICVLGTIILSNSTFLSYSGSACLFDFNKYLSIPDTDNQYVLSAFHVFDMNSSENLGSGVSIVDRTVTLCLNNGSFFKMNKATLLANIICHDEKMDLILFKIPNDSLNITIDPLKLTTRADIGDECYTCGFTTGQDMFSCNYARIRETSFFNSNGFSGISSPGPCIMTDSNESGAGNSGGPTINMKGELLGILSWGYNALLKSDLTVSIPRFGSFSVPYTTIDSFCKYAVLNINTGIHNVVGTTFDPVSSPILYILNSLKVNYTVSNLHNNVSNNTDISGIIIDISNSHIITNNPTLNTVLDGQISNLDYSILATHMSLDGLTYLKIGEMEHISSNKILLDIYYNVNNSTKVYLKCNIYVSKNAIETISNHTIELPLRQYSSTEDISIFSTLTKET